MGNKTLMSTEFGDLKFDGSLGIVESTVDDEDLVGTPCRVDVNELKMRYGAQFSSYTNTSFDILDVGYWDAEGSFTPPCREWQEESKAHVISEIVSGITEQSTISIEISDESFYGRSYESLVNVIREIITIRIIKRQ